jgi:translation initiation factor IF-2
VKAVIETKEPVKEPVKRRKKRLFRKKSSSKEETSAEEAITTQYQKLSGTKLTGRLICLSLINRKEKRRA